MKRIVVLWLLGIALAVPSVVFSQGNADPCCDQEESEGSCPRITMMLEKRQELGLTTEQTKKIRAIKTALLRENELRVAQLSVMRPNLKNLMAPPYPDMPALKDSLKKVSELELQMHLRKFEALSQAHALLNSDQQARYAALWKKKQLQKRDNK